MSSSSVHHLGEAKLECGGALVLVFYILTSGGLQGEEVHVRVLLAAAYGALGPCQGLERSLPALMFGALGT